MAEVTALMMAEQRRDSVESSEALRTCRSGTGGRGTVAQGSCRFLLRGFGLRTAGSPGAVAGLPWSCVIGRASEGAVDARPLSLAGLCRARVPLPSLRDRRRPGSSSSSAAVAAPGTRAVLGRRRGGGLKAWLQWLGNHPGGEQLAEFDSEFPGAGDPECLECVRCQPIAGSRRPSLVRTTSSKPA